jgi:hypothetical protein
MGPLPSVLGTQPPYSDGEAQSYLARPPFTKPRDLQMV